MAESLGVNIDRLFTITFALAAGWRRSDGLGAEFLGLIRNIL
jgi:branched-chain amino acid transport system permease protein